MSGAERAGWEAGLLLRTEACEDATWALRHRAAVKAVLVLLRLVGLQFRPLQRLQGAPLPAMVESGLLRTTGARGGAQWATLVSAPAHAHFRRQTWCCGSDFHRSRSLQSIPFRDAGRQKSRGLGGRRGEESAGTVIVLGRRSVWLSWALRRRWAVSDVPRRW